MLLYKKIIEKIEDSPDTCVSLPEEHTTPVVKPGPKEVCKRIYICNGSTFKFHSTME